MLAWRSVGHLVLRRDSIVLNGYQSSLSRIPPWNLFRTQYKDAASTADFISPKVTRPDTPHAKRETSMMRVPSNAATSAEKDIKNECYSQGRIRTTVNHERKIQGSSPEKRSPRSADSIGVRDLFTNTDANEDDWFTQVCPAVFIL